MNILPIKQQRDLIPQQVQLQKQTLEMDELKHISETTLALEMLNYIFQMAVED
jgi:hypothetical protein